LIMSSLLLVLAGTMGDNGWNSRLHLLLCKQPLNRRKPELRWHEPKGPPKVTSWAERLGRRGPTADVGKHSRPSRRGELRRRAEAGEQKTGLAREFGMSREALYQHLRTGS
jgi:ribosomal protein S14